MLTDVILGFGNARELRRLSSAGFPRPGVEVPAFGYAPGAAGPGSSELTRLGASISDRDPSGS